MSGRGATDYGPFVSDRISPSRVNAYLSCGVAFRMKYVENLPEQASGSAALFGSVMHEALEKWAIDRNQDLVRLVAQAWMRVTEGTPVSEFIGQYQRISVRAMKLEKEIRDDWEARGKESKSPRMTAVWKKSDIAQEIEDLLKVWLPVLRTSPWRFKDRDQLPTLYDESLILAKKYARKWKHLPRPLYTEFGFDVEWRGFSLHGYIDTIEPVLDTVTGEVLDVYLVNDYKSYAREPAEQKDWRQVTIYDVAVRDMIASGALDLDPDYLILTCIDYLRLLERRYWEIGEADHAKLYEELSMYRRGVDAEVFLPASKNSNPDFCAYPENCCMRTKGDGIGSRIEFSQEEADAVAS